MYEKRLKAVPAQSFTADGSIDGKINIVDTRPFKVKQTVILIANTLVPLELEVKRIDDMTTMYVGPLTGNIDSRTDISAYATGLNAALFANEQLRSKVPEQEIERLTYEEEPTVARRVVNVDPFGNIYSSENPFPVEATINVSNIGTPTIYNVPLTFKDTEYSQNMPSGTAQFLLRARNNAKLQLSYTSGQTNVNYLTISPGTMYIVESVKLTGKTVYLQSSKDNTVVEIVAWT